MTEEQPQQPPSLEEIAAMLPVEQLEAENEARHLRLMQAGVVAPMDMLYLVSLVEYALGDELDKAREHHQRRIFPFLVQREQVLAGAMAAGQQAQARKTLLHGVVPGI